MQQFAAREYLMIDIANNFGQDNDKKLWNDRLSWFDSNEHQLEQLLPEAKETALYYAGVKAWRDVQKGKPIGYMISLDATSSGLQLLAALTGDTSAAKLCNVIPTGKREDAYTKIYQEMLFRIQDTAKITRDDTKHAIMTALYCSTAIPKQVFGEGALLDTFYKTLSDLAPAAWELNQAMLSLWQSDALSHNWIMPDNFHVKIKVMSQVTETVHFLNQPFDVSYSINAPMDEGLSLSANMTHSVDGFVVREITRRCDYDPTKIDKLRSVMLLDSFNNNTGTMDDDMVVILWNRYKESGYLSARILDHLSMDNLGHIDDITVLTDLITSLPNKPFKVVSIHDCFRCLPQYGNDLRIQYNRQLMLIAKSNLLSNLISQIINKPIQINKLNPGLWKNIMETDYALS